MYNFDFIHYVIENIYLEIQLYKIKIWQKTEKLSRIQLITKRNFRKKYITKRYCRKTLDSATKQNDYVTQSWFLLIQQCEQECDSKKRTKEPNLSTRLNTGERKK